MKLTMQAASILCTVDVVLLTLTEGGLRVALLRRDRAPFAEGFGLPGGYVHAQEDTDTQAAAARVLKDKLGLQGLYLEQLQTFSGPSRDPRGWSVSVAYLALVNAQVLAALQGTEVLLADVDQLWTLPFDHNEIVAAAVARVRNKSLYSSLPAYLCPPEFTLSQLQAVYERVLGEPLPKVSFRRKVTELDMLEEVVRVESAPNPAHRPPQRYRLKPQYQHALALSARPF